MKARVGRRGSQGAEGNGEREVFRSPGGAVLWWFWLVLAVLILADVGVQRWGRGAVVAVLAVLAATGVAYACAWRPRIVADADGVTVENPLRDHHVPWEAVDRVDAANALRVHLLPRPGAARGRVVSSWAVQSSPRAALRREMADRRVQQRGGRGGGSGRWPGAADATRQAVGRDLAQHAVERLSERALLARQTARPAGAGGPENPEGRPGEPAAQSADGGRATARWAWPSIAAMALPVAALVVALLA